MNKGKYLKFMQVIVGSILVVFLTACGEKVVVDENSQETTQADTPAANDEEAGRADEKQNTTGEVTMDTLLSHAETPAEEFDYVIGGNETVIIEGYTGKDPIVVIPDNIEGYPVSAIRKLGTAGIEAIKLSDSVETIENNCFMPTDSEIDSIKIVVLGKGVKTIGNNAFMCCSNLKEVKLNEGLEQIGELAFASTGASEIVIPESVSSIGGGAFNMDESQTLYVQAGSYAESWCEERKEAFTNLKYVTE